MRKSIDLIIPTDPRSKQSARFSIQNGKLHSHKDSKVVAKENEILYLLKDQIPKDWELFRDKPLKATCLFVFPPVEKLTNKKHTKLLESGEIFYKVTKPDLTDNLPKLIFDVLEGIVMDNDSRICSMESHKIYGLEPRYEITIEVMENVNFLKPKS